MEKTLYYELDTEYGPLYIYERYKSDESQMPEMREFFTQEKAWVCGYGILSFLTDEPNGKCFKMCEFNMEGKVLDNYMTKLSPYEFLCKVGGYLETSEKFEAKKESVYRIFKMKNNHQENNRVIPKPLEISEDQKNKVAEKILVKYLPPLGK